MFLLQHKEKMSVQLFIHSDVQHTAPGAVAIKAALPQLTWEAPLSNSSLINGFNIAIVANKKTSLSRRHERDNCTFEIEYNRHFSDWLNLPGNRWNYWTGCTPSIQQGSLFSNLCARIIENQCYSRAVKLPLFSTLKHKDYRKATTRTNLD